MSKDSKISKSNPVPQSSRAAQAHPRQPSPRNVEVHDCVRLHGQTQEEVAQRYGLTQGRVSRICTQVQAWREWADERPAGNRIWEERRRVARRLFRQRYEQIYAAVIRNLAINPHDRQLLKLAARMLRDLCKLCALDGDPPPGGHSNPPAAAPAGGRQAAAKIRNITNIGSVPCSLPSPFAGPMPAAVTAVDGRICGESLDEPRGGYAALAAGKKIM